MRSLYVLTLFFVTNLICPIVNSQPIELDSELALVNKVKEFRATVLFIGYGSKNQYKDISKVLSDIDGVVSQLNQTYGKGQWAAVFGGDGFKAEKPDIAHIMKHLKEKHAVTLVAIQSDIVKQWGGVDKHIDFVRYVPTVEVPVLAPDGSQLIEGGKPKTSVHWGGLIDGKPKGPTGSYLGSAFLDGPNPPLKHVVAVGGGPVSLDEMTYAYNKGVEVAYLKAESKYPEVNGKFGAVDDWANQNLKPPTEGNCIRVFGVLTRTIPKR